jgi:hypothetical protein
MIYYNYSREEIASMFKISVNAVSQGISLVRSTGYKQDLADELYRSLEVLYGEARLISLDAYTRKLTAIFANENNFGIRSTGDLNKLEIWLINRLYKLENK